MPRDDQENNKSEEHSSFFLQLISKHLPSDDAHEERPIGTKGFILWMIGIIAGLFILRNVFSLLFQ